MPTSVPITIVEEVVAVVPILTAEVPLDPVAISTLVEVVEVVPILTDGAVNVSAIRTLVDDNLMPFVFPDWMVTAEPALVLPMMTADEPVEIAVAMLTLAVPPATALAMFTVAVPLVTVWAMLIVSVFAELACPMKISFTEPELHPAACPNLGQAALPPKGFNQVSAEAEVAPRTLPLLGAALGKTRS